MGEIRVGQLFRWLWVAQALSWTVGCAGDGDAMKKRIHDLEGEVTRLQNQSDRLEERLAGVEIGARAQTAAPAAPADPRAQQEGRPLLQVVRLEPGAAAQAADPELPPADPAEDPARPVVRVQGSKVSRAFEGVRAAEGQP